MSIQIDRYFNAFKAQGFEPPGAPKLVPYVGAGKQYFKFIPDEAGVTFDANCRVVVYVQSKLGTPLGGRLVINQTVAGDQERKETDGIGRFQFNMGNPGSGYAGINQGPHKVWVEEPGIGSDVVEGFGLPNGHHADFTAIFRLVDRDDAGNGDDDDDDNGQTEEPPGCLLAILQIIKRTLVGGGK